MPKAKTWRFDASMVVSAITLPLSAEAAHAQSDADATGVFLIAFLMFLLVACSVYFIPSFIAFARDHPNRWLILVINTLFGATGLGWLGSLVWACNALHRSSYRPNGGESGLNLFVNDTPLLTSDASARLPIDEIGRLKSLLDAGALDLDEYQSLKRRLLR